MRRYTEVTQNIRDLFPNLPKEAKFIGIQNDKINWDVVKTEYSNGLLMYGYVNETEFIEISTDALK